MPRCSAHAIRTQYAAVALPLHLHIALHFLHMHQHCNHAPCVCCCNSCSSHYCQTASEAHIKVYTMHHQLTTATLPLLQAMRRHSVKVLHTTATARRDITIDGAAMLQALWHVSRSLACYTDKCETLLHTDITQLQARCKHRQLVLRFLPLARPGQACRVSACGYMLL